MTILGEITLQRLKTYTSWGWGWGGIQTLPMPCFLSPPHSLDSTKGCSVALNAIDGSLHACLSQSWGFVASSRCMAGGKTPGMDWESWRELSSTAHQARMINIILFGPDVSDWPASRVGWLCPRPSAFSPLQFRWQVNFRAECCCEKVSVSRWAVSAGDFQDTHLWGTLCAPGCFESTLLPTLNYSLTYLRLRIQGSGCN